MLLFLPYLSSPLPPNTHTLRCDGGAAVFDVVVYLSFFAADSSSYSFLFLISFPGALAELVRLSRYMLLVHK